jgi:hypothetical protein
MAIGAIMRLRIEPATLSLPNVVATWARHDIGRFLLGELAFANGARFGHEVRHLPPRLHCLVYRARVMPESGRGLGSALPTLYLPSRTAQQDPLTVAIESW